MDNKKYVLREYFGLCDGGKCEDLLTESEKLEIKNNGATYLTGLAQRAETKNQNGRIYPYNVLAREVKNYEKFVRENRAVGELNHADTMVVDPNKASHLIKEIWMKGNEVYVKLKLLNTPCGNIAKNLVNDGVSIGLSSRGMGSLKETREGLIVEDDFSILCWDIVLDPSTQGAFMNLMESKEPIKYSKSDRIYRMINDILGE